MRKNARSQFRPLFDNLDLRIAPSSAVVAIPTAPPADMDVTTNIHIQPPPGAGGGTPKI